MSGIKSDVLVIGGGTAACVGLHRPWKQERK